MKKRTIGVVVGLFIILVIVGVLYFALRKNLTPMTYIEYQEKIENKETFILYLGSKDCSHCLSFRPTLERILRKYKLTIHYLDVSTLSETEYAKVQNKTHLEGTPTVVFIKEGRVKTSPKIKGEMPYSNAVEIFKESGYIK